MRYIPPGQLYRGLYARLVAMLPQEIDSRVTNLVYLMRVYSCRTAGRRLNRLLTTPGDWYWLPYTNLTQANAYPTRLLLCWKRGKTKPWLLATNLTHPPDILRLYGIRVKTRVIRWP